jgi:hypothetical protein
VTAKHFAVVYSIHKKHLRRMLTFRGVTPWGRYYDEWWMYDEDFYTHTIFPGERMLLVSLDWWGKGHETCMEGIDRAVFAAEGVHPILPGNPFGNCAVIDPVTSLVVDIIRADDELDTMPNVILRNDPFARKGDVYIGGVFKRIANRSQLMNSTSELKLAA